jgi:uncharacterized protein
MRGSFRKLSWIAAVLSAAAYSATNASPTPLVDAVKNHDTATVRALLKAHAGANRANANVNVNQAEPDGTTALHWAAHWNDLDTVDALLAAGADARATNRYGVTPLSEAATHASAAVVERLLKAGADPNTLTSTQGGTVLMRAARVGNLDAVKTLLDHGAYVDARESYRGQTALMWAAAEGHVDIVKLLIAHGADMSVRSIDRDTKPPKMEAGTPSAPIARGGLTALQFAARNGQIETTRALIEGKADINQQDSDGNTALVLAILNTHYDLAQLLIDKGANPNVANDTGRAALFTAIDVHDVDWSPRPARRETDKLSSLDIIKSLLDHKANVNQRLTAASPIIRLAQDTGDRSLSAGATPFMRAARSADVEVMRLLLAHGADPKLANKDGLNALMLASGVSWSDKIRGTQEEALEAVKLCKEQGLDVTAANQQGMTALHGAASRGADAIVRYLAENGAKLDAKNKKGFTPYDIAMGKGGMGGARGPVHESTAKLLRQLMTTSAAENTSKP